MRKLIAAINMTLDGVFDHSTVFRVWEKTIFGILSIAMAKSFIDFSSEGFTKSVRQNSIS